MDDLRKQLQKVSRGENVSVDNVQRLQRTRGDKVAKKYTSEYGAPSFNSFDLNEIHKFSNLRSQFEKKVKTVIGDNAKYLDDASLQELAKLIAEKEALQEIVTKTFGDRAEMKTTGRKMKNTVFNGFSSLNPQSWNKWRNELT